MTSQDRKRDLVREYKEREIRQGIFAIRCSVSGEAWVDIGRDLDKQQNRIWLELQMGAHRCRTMQAAWNAHGAQAMAYEILEVVQDDNPLLIPALLKERAVQWRSELGAGKIYG